jgi:Tfp pilus assembly protein PilO
MRFLARLSRREQLLLSALGLALVGAVLYVFVHEPLARRLAQARRELAQANARLAQVQALEARAGAMQVQLQEVDRQLARFGEGVPPGREDAVLLAYVSDAAAESGVEVFAVKFGTTSTVGPLVREPVEVSARGGFAQQALFATLLTQMPRRVLLQGMTLKARPATPAGGGRTSGAGQPGGTPPNAGPPVLEGTFHIVVFSQGPEEVPGPVPSPRETQRLDPFAPAAVSGGSGRGLGGGRDPGDPPRPSADP